jgi:hypothetical protein
LGQIISRACGSVNKAADRHRKRYWHAAASVNVE